MTDQYPKLNEFLHFKRQFSEDRQFGIEIETEGRNLLDFRPPKPWIPIDDPSLRGESVEFILDQPIPIDEVKAAVKGLQKKLKADGAILNLSDRCGTHVHVNVQHYNYYQLMNFMCLYLILEPLMVAYCGEDRVGNVYCLRAEDAEELVHTLLYVKQYGDLLQIIREGDRIRYASMNMTAIGKFGSLEFRSLKTPENFNDIFTWVKLIHAIKKAAENFESPAQMVETFSRYGWEDFLKKVFIKNNTLINRFSPGELVAGLLRGIRIVQGIAYAEVIKPPMKRKETPALNTKKAEILNNAAEVDDWAQPGAIRMERHPINFDNLVQEEVNRMRAQPNLRNIEDAIAAPPMPRPRARFAAPPLGAGLRRVPARRRD